jgi:hypothetical protein
VQQAAGRTDSRKFVGLHRFFVFSYKLLHFNRIYELPKDRCSVFYGYYTKIYQSPTCPSGSFSRNLLYSFIGPSVFSLVFRH